MLGTARNYIWAITVCVIAAGTAIFVGAQTVDGPEKMYYYYEGRLITLNPFPGDLIVGLRSGGSQNAVQSTLDDLASLGIEVRNYSIDRRQVVIREIDASSGLASAVRNLPDVISLRPKYTVSRSAQELTIVDEALAVFQNPIGLNEALEIGRPYHLLPDSTWLGSPSDIWLFSWQGDEQRTLAEAIGQLRNHSLVLSAEPNIAGGLKIHEQLIPNDAFWGKQWNLSRIGLSAAWEDVYGVSAPTAETINLAVLDTWIWPENPAYYGRVVSNLSLVVESWGDRENSHGTRMASIAASSTNDGFRIAGVAGGWGPSKPGVQLILVEMIGREETTTSRAVQALDYAANSGADVITCSWGLTQGSGALDQKLTSITHWQGRHDGRGIVVVFATGNGAFDPSYDYTMGEPSDHPDVIAVGATDFNDVRYAYSQYDASGALDLVAPSGFYVYAELPPSDWKERVPSTGVQEIGAACFPYDVFSDGGTSAAAPLVAGTAALTLSVRPDLSSFEVREILTGTAKKISGGTRYKTFQGEPPAEPAIGPYEYDANGHNIYIGYGQLDAEAALEEALSYPPQVTGLQAHEPNTTCNVPGECWGAGGDPLLGKGAEEPGEGIWCVKLTWDRPGGTGWHNYVIFRSEDGEFFAPVYWTDHRYWTCYVDSRLESNATYWWKVAEVSLTGKIGTRSEPVTMTMPEGGGELSAGPDPNDVVPFGLGDPWPNPFNSEMVVKFGLEQLPGNISIDIYNVRGEAVRQLTPGNVRIGTNEVRWDGKNSAGRPVASGIYLVILEADGRRSTKKVTLVR